MMNLTELRAFLLSGQATFTMTSRGTGTRFTYRVRKGSSEHRYFVSILTGPDNQRDYDYAGMLEVSTTLSEDSEQPFLSFRATRGSLVTDSAASWRGFAWLVRQLNRGIDPIVKAEFDHMGRCGRCGRALTVPESVRTGLGPECATKV